MPPTAAPAHYRSQRSRPSRRYATSSRPHTVSTTASVVTREWLLTSCALSTVQLKVPDSVQQEEESNNSKHSERVRYQHIWEDEQFSMG